MRTVKLRNSVHAHSNTEVQHQVARFASSKCQTVRLLTGFAVLRSAPLPIVRRAQCLHRDREAVLDFDGTRFTYAELLHDSRSLARVREESAWHPLAAITHSRRSCARPARFNAPAPCQVLGSRGDLPSLSRPSAGAAVARRQGRPARAARGLLGACHVRLRRHAVGAHMRT